MNETIVSTKGAVVIPAALRKKLGILPGEKVAVTEINGKLQIIPLSRDPVSSLRGCLKKGKTVKELIAQARKRDTEHEVSLASRRKMRESR